MTDSDLDHAARLARLAERRSTAAADPGRHLTTRILVGGISLAAFLGGVARLASNDAVATIDASTPAPRPVVVRYVDAHGNPVAPPEADPVTTAAPATAVPTTAVPTTAAPATAPPAPVPTTAAPEITTPPPPTTVAVTHHRQKAPKPPACSGSRCP